MKACALRRMASQQVDGVQRDDGLSMVRRDRRCIAIEDFSRGEAAGLIIPPKLLKTWYLGTEHKRRVALDDSPIQCANRRTE
jgi:hypothetical protein